MFKAASIASSAIIVVSISSPASVQALTVSATVAGAVSMTQGASKVPFTITNTSGPNSQTASGSGSMVFTNVGTGDDNTLLYYNHADGSAYAYASPGTVKVKATGSAGLQLLNAVNIPYFTPDRPWVQSSASALFIDNVVVGSNLAPGTETQWKFTLDLDLKTNNSAAGSFSIGFQVANNYGTVIDYLQYYPVPLGGGVPSWEFSQPFIVNARAGETLTVALQMGASANNVAGGQDSFLPFKSETIIDASHTAHVYIDSLTPGVKLISESGHDYSSSGDGGTGSPVIPEPTTALLVPMGIGAVLFRRKALR